VTARKFFALCPTQYCAHVHIPIIASAPEQMYDKIFRTAEVNGRTALFCTNEL